MYLDIAIGAPGDGNDGESSGTVYIFFGRSRSDGSIYRTPSQVREFQQPNNEMNN